MSWEEIVGKKGEPWVNACVESGRVIWRQCPKTPGLFEYQDTMNFIGEKIVRKDKINSKKQTTTDSALENLEDIEAMMESGFKDLLTDLRGEAKGKGKGSFMLADYTKPPAEPKAAKGKGKGKNKGGNTPASDPEEEEDDDAAFEQAVTKTRSMQLLVTKTKMNIEELLPGLKKTGFATKAMFESLAEVTKQLDGHLRKCKDIIVNRRGPVTAIKDELSAAAGAVKEAIEWTKKMKIMADSDDAKTTVSAKRGRK